MAKLSIIVPVYNVEPYLHKCLESIMNQTFRDFEVIVIDDGSTDRSGIICDEFAEVDNRFTVIHQQNKGVSASRNRGLELAHGEYVSFIDSDDWIEPEMYGEMIDTSIRYSVDIVACDYRQGNGNDHRPEDIYEKTFTQEELLMDAFGIPSLLLGVCWNKLFSRQCINDIRFESKLANYEDTVFLCNSYLNCNGAVYLGKKFYVVTVRNDSASRKRDVKTIVSKYHGCMFLHDMIIEMKVSKAVKKQVSEKTLDTLLKHIKEAKLTGNNDSCEKLVKVLKQEVVNKSILSLIKGYISPGKAYGFIRSII